MRWFRSNLRITLPLTALVAAGLAWLAFGYFGVHLLLVDDRVDEAVPLFDAEPADAAPAATADPPATTPPVAPSTTEPATAATTTPPVTTAPATTPATTTPATTAPAAPQVVTELVGAFTSLNHPTSGTALVLGNGTGQRFLRFEGFETDNGPDLNVYLVNRAAGGVSDVVDLGDLKGNVGDQNYEIPAGVDLATYDTVLIWCVRFSSGFGEATLAAP
jgi:hypothetical protein